MTDCEALIAAILKDRDDDTPRLAFADWCDENDRSLRAEFIKVQIALARFPKEPPYPKITPIPQKCKKCKAWYADMGLCGCEYGKRRSEAHKQMEYNLAVWDLERRNLHVRQSEILQDDGWDGQRGIFRVLGEAVKGDSDEHETRPARPMFAVYWNRGFINRIEVPWVEWRFHSFRMIRTEPLEEVTFTTRPCGGPLLDGSGNGLTNRVEWREWSFSQERLLELWPGIKFNLMAGAPRETAEGSAATYEAVG